MRNQERLLKGFINQNSVTVAEIIKSNQPTSNIGLKIIFENNNTLYFNKDINPLDPGDMPEVLGLINVLQQYVEIVKKEENPEPAIPATPDDLPPLPKVGEEVSEGEIAEENTEE